MKPIVVLLVGDDRDLLRELELRELLRTLVDEVFAGPMVIDIARPEPEMVRSRGSLLEPLVPGIGEHLASLDLSISLEELRLERRNISPKQAYVPPLETKAEMRKRLRSANRPKTGTRH